MSLQVGVPRGFCYAAAPADADPYRISTEKRLLQDNLGLILEHYANVLTVSEYFFCPVSFAYCSAGIPGAVALACALRLGHLLMGWRNGILVAKCPLCDSAIYVTAFGGNLKEDWHWTEALCTECTTFVRFRSPRDATNERITFTKRVIKRVPEYIEEFEQYAGYSFCWSGGGLAAATKSRIVLKCLYAPVPLDVLIYELQNGFLREGRAPSVGLSDEQIRRKLKPSSAFY